MGFDVQQLLDGFFFGMFWIGWIFWCWLDFLVVFVNKFFIVEVFIGCIFLVNFVYFFMQIFGKGFCQVIGDGFDYDFVIVIMLCFIGICQCVFFQVVGYGEGVDVVCFVVQFWCDKIGEVVVGEVNFFCLLVQMMVYCQYVGVGFIVIDFNIVVYVVGWEQIYYVLWVQGFFCVQFIQQFVSVFEQVLCFFFYYFIFQNVWIFICE